MKIGILGTGSWGTALAQVLVDSDQDVIMWGIDENQVNDINNNHKNSVFFDCDISEKIKATTDLGMVKDADVILLAVPSIAIESVIKSINEILEKPVYVINVAKGFHPITHERLSVYIQNNFPKEKLKAVISLIGPSHAEEVIERKLTVVNAVSEDEEAAKEIQKLFANEYFRVYRNTDVIGSEIGVALKNVMAIASGILNGIGQGDNARAALITRGLAEMTRFGVALGAKKETFLGLDGVGDMIVTCTSKHSRNYNAGLVIGKNDSAEEFMKENTKTVEGIFACEIVYIEAKKLNIEMPITNEVYEILFENKKPSEAINDLMRRKLKAE